ncbi:selenite/tellurite reduction operon b-type cytochrome membrane protein ExtQ [Geobacter benzoatilyticus]|uniref:Cytochrome B6 n=1 Tax=Geobacter benzoatilyticus TaxID=2815309 RepID=A0ABX7Q8S8_9BACT|nr:selenite/tellurite reduction operon b-type cytochrome membrane protein ExtQ [Geobacter benzoatilyticus]QSV47251.1 cytochrome B6 [Geobacter benzoatilyticus]
MAERIEVKNDMRRGPRGSGEYVRSSPCFFRLVKRAFWGGMVALALLAVVIPAPLLDPANPGAPPNPAKSAWFLLWTQEVVSHGNGFAWIIVGLSLWFMALPWLGKHRPERAVWFGEGNRAVAWTTIAVFAAIVSMTVLAMFFRGENWSLVSPF